MLWRKSQAIKTSPRKISTTTALPSAKSGLMALLRSACPSVFLNVQADHPGETSAMRAQRTRFKDAVAKFSLLSRADRERWYARMPPWSSYLWYYNWFMLNAIPNLWQAVPGGDAVLNNIQTIKTSLAIAGGLVNIPSTVVATKMCCHVER